MRKKELLNIIATKDDELLWASGEIMRLEQELAKANNSLDTMEALAKENLRLWLDQHSAVGKLIHSEAKQKARADEFEKVINGLLADMIQQYEYASIVVDQNQEPKQGEKLF